MAAGVATCVILAPALYGVFSQAGADGVPVLTALVAAAVGAGAMGILAAVVVHLWAVEGYRASAMVAVAIGSLLLWWLLVVLSPTLGLIYQNVTNPDPEECRSLVSGEGCL